MSHQWWEYAIVGVTDAILVLVFAAVVVHYRRSRNEH